MAKRKQITPSVNTDLLRWGVTAVIVLVSLFLAVQAVSGFLQHARTFSVERISFSEGMGTLSIPELEKLKRRNIFTVDLSSLEGKIRSKYPRLGGVSVVRKFPDEIVVSGFLRDPVALAAVGGRLLVVSRDGVFIGSPDEKLSELPVIKGLVVSKTASGTPVGDDRLSFANNVIDTILKDQALTSIGFRSLDIHDPEKLVCVFGKKEGTFEVILNQERVEEELRTLMDMARHGNLDFSAIKYIDLRFKQPVIGQKKKRK